MACSTAARSIACASLAELSCEPAPRRWPRQRWRIDGLARTPAALAQEPAPERVWKHGLSLFGDLKYPADFKQFDYVNANAPKGGAARLMAFGTFDNFNMVVAGVKGSLVAGMELIYDTLMVAALDEVSTEYGLLAEAVSHPEDHSSVTYRLRANAKWHDGKPVTVEDVIFSFHAFKTNHPQWSAYYSHVTKAEKTGEREVTFTFDGAGNRELPQIVGQLKVLPKHWWEGTDKAGNKRDIAATTLEPPLGCGAYRLKEFVPGRTVVYERVADYWGKDVNVNIGRDNFNEQRFEYFRDATVAIEAFKADALDWRTENSAKNWATAYDFPAVKDGRVRQGGVSDPVLRRHAGLCLQHPPAEIRRSARAPRLQLRAQFRRDEPADVLQPVPAGEELLRRHGAGVERIAGGRRARDPGDGARQGAAGGVHDGLHQSGQRQPGGDAQQPSRSDPAAARSRLSRSATDKLVDTKTGQPFTAEILIDQPEWERLVLPYKQPLERLGIQMSLRIVDDAQYENRLRQWDYDIIVASWGQSLSPGNEQRGYWSSKAADQQGSRNLVGIKNPAVDTLIERLIYATNRADLMAATKALDRVLLWNFYVVPQWTYGKVRSARWDRFGRPDPLPKYGLSGFPTVWWWDQAKASKVGSRS